MSMKQDRIRQIVVAVAIFITIVINLLANALPLNGQYTKDLSDSFKIFFVPDGYVFAIWGLIYIGLIAFAIYQFLPAQANNPRLRRIGYLPAVAGLFNSVWIFLWHYKVFDFTLLAMLGLLGSLIAIYLRLKVNHIWVSRAERYMVNLPHSIYLGWISVATIANVTQSLFYWKWDGFGIAPQVWAAILLGVAAILAGLMAWFRRDAGYLLVLVWAFIGIAVKFPAEPLVNITAWVTAVLVAGMAIYSFLAQRKQSLAED
jgi:benzodiazapine receptor